MNMNVIDKKMDDVEKELVECLNVKGINRVLLDEMTVSPSDTPAIQIIPLQAVPNEDYVPAGKDMWVFTYQISVYDLVKDQTTIRDTRRLINTVVAKLRKEGKGNRLHGEVFGLGVENVKYNITELVDEDYYYGGIIQLQVQTMVEDDVL